MTVTTGKRPSGIRTRHAGTEFRSRLEARWAAFFTLIGWRWTYEPFDADGYIPDFLIHGVNGATNLLVEIGPCEYLSDFSTKAAKAREALPDRPVLVLGIDPIILLDVGWQTAAGYLTDDGWHSGPDIASWARCSRVIDERVCDRIGVFHQSGSYQLMPCGHHDGDHHLRGHLTPDDLTEYWAEAEAGNRVQWRPR